MPNHDGVRIPQNVGEAIIFEEYKEFRRCWESIFFICNNQSNANLQVNDATLQLNANN